MDGRQILLGNLRLMEQRDIPLNGLLPQATCAADQAKTVMWLAVDGQAAA
ncbi:MAG: hypothetical protein R2856_26315 [Caldilineaceae bacterium]